MASLKIQFSRDYSAEIDCVLVDNLHSCMILGLDFLKSITITENSAHIIINGHTLPTISKLDYSFAAYPVENTTIPPYSYKRVELRNTRQFQAKTIAVQNLKHSKRKINVETSIQRTSDQPFVIVRNNSPNSLQVSRNAPICTIQEIEVEVVNGVTRMTDLAAEKEEIDYFQLQREKRAEKIGFVPPIKSFGNLDEHEQNEVSDLIQSYRLAFTMADDDLGRLGYYRFTIPMIDESDTSYIPPRPVPIGLRSKVESEIDTWKQLGIIEPTQSGFNTPLIILKKGDGSIRISLDARNLNGKIRQDRFPLPSMTEIFSKLGERLSGSKSCYISQFDLSRGYWQVQVSENDCHKLSFSHNRRHYQANRLLYGISTGPAAFSRIMNEIFGDNESFLLYLDDLLIIDNDYDRHMENLEFLFSSCIKHGLLLSAKKSSLMDSKIEFLGHQIDHEGIRPLPKHLVTINQFPVPTDRTSLKRFLGTVNYNLKYVDGLAVKLAPLHKLLTKEYEKFTWPAEAAEAFETVKREISNASKLFHHDLNLPLYLANDASGYGIGSCLYQLNKDKMEPLGYFSRALKGPDLRRPTRQRELIALAEGIRHFEYHLLNRRFTVLSDHKSLTYLYREHLHKRLDLRLANIMFFLADFDFEIVHKPGNDPVMFTPDYLSRLPSTSFKVIENEVKSEEIPDRVFALYHFPQSKLNDKDVHRDLYLRTLVDSKNQPPVTKDVIIHFGEVELSSSSLKAAQEKDDWCRNILFMLKNNSKNKTTSKFGLIDDVLYSTEKEVNRPVIVEPHASEFITYCHSSYGHPGTYATMKLVSKYVYINKLKEAAAHICSNCIDCLRSKPRAALRPAMIPVRHYPDAPWTYSAVDLYDLGVADNNRKRYLLTMIDHLTGFLDGIPIASKSDRLVANAMNELLLRHGLTGRVLLDNGREFGPLFSGLLRRFNIQMIHTSSYNSRSNGKLERCHRSITEKLKLLNAKRSEWSSHWPYVQFLINNLPKSNLDGLSACEALYGRSMFAPFAEIRHAQPEPCSEGFVKALNRYISDLHPSLMAHHYAKYEKDLKKDNGKVIQLKKGTKVLLYKPDIKEGKLSRVWSGPYVVERNYSQNSYVIKDPERGQTFTRHLRFMRVLHDQPPTTPEDIIPDDEEEPVIPENENNHIISIFSESFGPDLL